MKRSFIPVQVTVLAALAALAPLDAGATTTYENNDTINIGNSKDANRHDDNFVNGESTRKSDVVHKEHFSSRTGSSDESGKYRRLPVTVNSTDRDSAMSNNWRQ